MTGVEELAQLEFAASEVIVPPITAADWRKRAEDEFNNYQLLVPILNLDDTELVD